MREFSLPLVCILIFFWYRRTATETCDSGFEKVRDRVLYPFRVGLKCFESCCEKKWFGHEHV